MRYLAEVEAAGASAPAEPAPLADLLPAAAELRLERRAAEPPDAGDHP
jgi:hypothetical protein